MNRKNYIIMALSFLFGGLISLLIMYFIYFQYCKNNWEQQGYHTGYSTAQFEMYEKIKNELGEVSPNSKSKNFFTVKDADVVILNIDGVKTVRAAKY